MRILVTGITGAVGGALAPRLVRDGHTVRALSRRVVSDPAATPLPAEVELLVGDALAPADLQPALEGIEVAYYLIHSLEPVAGAGVDTDGPGAAVTFAEREARSARNFARAAAAAGVRRLVYLGALAPPAGSGSAHLRSRLEVERTLLEAVPDSIALRSSIVIGARSRSFRLLVRLIGRMPLLALPGWRTHRTAPVDARDVTECLARSATAAGLGGRVLDLGGREIVTYGALIERIRELMLVERPLLRIPAGPSVARRAASRIAAAVAAEDHALVGPLMDGLHTDLLPREPGAAELLGVRRHRLDAAIEHALRELEAIEPVPGR